MGGIVAMKNWKWEIGNGECAMGNGMGNSKWAMAHIP
jgi:hypothetical protein